MPFPPRTTQQIGRQQASLVQQPAPGNGHLVHLSSASRRKWRNVPSPASNRPRAGETMRWSAGEGDGRDEVSAGRPALARARFFRYIPAGTSQRVDLVCDSYL
jgi:hypothetical protein